MYKLKKFLWRTDFPKIYSHTTVAFLKNRKGFWEAKNGDQDCAKSVVEQCVKQSCIEMLKEKFFDCVLLPVKGSDNVLPLAYAEKIGLPQNTDVECLTEKSRKNMSGIERFLHRPMFFGKIEMGRKYVLVDDIVCQGGVVSSLNKFVCDNGGIVCGVTALAHSAGNGFIAPTVESLDRLLHTFDFHKLQSLLHVFGFQDGVLELTYQQVMYLLKFKSYANLSKRMHNVALPKNQGNYCDVSSHFFDGV